MQYMQHCTGLFFVVCMGVLLDISRVFTPGSGRWPEFKFPSKVKRIDVYKQ
jgi:hypothetical protein